MRRRPYRHRTMLGASAVLICGGACAANAMAAPPAGDQTNNPAPAAAAPAAPAPADATDTINTTTLDNVTVTGNSGFLKMLTGQAQIPDATQTITTVTEAQIQDATSPIEDFAAALTNQPNFIRSHTGSNDSGSDYHLRGFDDQHLGLLVDGIPTNSSDDGSVYTNDETNNYAISSIDIMPGAGSASVPGLSNFGGTISVHTKDPQPNFYIQPYIGVGSFHNKQYGTQINTGRFLDDTTSAILSLSARDGDGYYDHTNTKYRNDTTLKTISLLPLGKLTLYFHSTDQSYQYYRGITDDERTEFGKRYNGYTNDPDSIYYYGYNYNKFYNNRSYIKYAINRGHIKTSDQFYYYHAAGYGASADDETINKQKYIYQVKSRHQEHRLGDLFNFAYETKYATLKTGLYWSYQDTLHISTRGALGSSSVFNPTYPIGDGPKLAPSYSETVHNTTYQPYVEADIHPVEKLTITPGLKYALINRTFYNNRAGSHRSVSYNRLLPSLGVNYQLVQGWNLYGNYTRSFKPPGYNQFYSGRFNLNLEPEEADSYELGTIWRQNRWSGRFTLFDTHYLSYIQSESFQRGSTSFSELVNAGSRVNDGVELDNSFVLTNWLSTFVNAGYLNAYYSNQSHPATYSPHNTESVGFRVKYHGWSGGISGDYESSHYVSIYDDAYYKIDSHVFTSAYAKYDVPDRFAKRMGVKKLSVSINLDNLTDDQYVTDASGDPDDSRKEYEEPIHVFAGLYVRF